MSVFNLGEKLRDKISGFEGIATARVEYVNGCIQYCLTPRVDKDKAWELPEAQFFDVERLEYVGVGIGNLPRRKSGVVGGPSRRSEQPPTR